MKKSPSTPNVVQPLPTLFHGGKWYTYAEASALAEKQANRGNYPVALEIFDLILAKVPDHFPTHYNRTLALHKMGRLEEALAASDKAIALDPDNAGAYNLRGTILVGLARLEEALASYDRAITLSLAYAEAHCSRGMVLEGMKRYDDALADYDRAIALKPDYAEAYCSRGNVLVTKGDLPEGERMFLKALELRPDFFMAMVNLTKIRKYQDVGHPDVAAIQSMVRKPGIPSAAKAGLFFGLGKIYDDCGHYDEAFECFQQGNQISSSIRSYDAQAVTKETDDIIRFLSKEFLAQHFTFSSDDASPLFVVGMPRSGTTLIASVLSNHRSIATAGELLTFNKFTSRLPEWTGVPYPEATRHIESSLAARLIQEYLEQLRHDVDGEILHVIDKYPLNFVNLGLVALLFPKARIIHCTRHPLDTGLSNYFQWFSSRYSYSFDLRSIGHYYLEYVRLMEHWRRALPLKMIEITYEDMVMNTEKTARAALDWLGLEWDERCLTPHTNPCAVETASQWQVRQPIYDRSIGRWRHYDKYLAPLKAAMEWNLKQ